MPIVLTSRNYSNFINENNDCNAIIKYSAPWCGPCRAMKPHFDHVENIIKNRDVDLAFYTVDIDDNPEISSDVTSVPTLVLIKNGAVVDIKVGLMNGEGILSWIGKYFELDLNKENIRNIQFNRNVQNNNYNSR
jgi:thiol-disulfide isomerase/thioredoxin